MAVATACCNSSLTGACRDERLNEPNKWQTVSRCWPTRGSAQPDQGLLGHLGRHTWMAVAIAADPGGKPQERRHVQGLAWIELRQGASQILDDVRHHFPQHGHDAQPALHFLDDRGWPGPDEVGLPELGQFGLEPDVQVRGLARQQIASVEPLQQLPQLPQLAADRTPFGFGRMGGEYQFDVEAVEQLLHVAGRESLGRPLSDRGADRLGPRRGMQGAFPLPQDPHALPILRDVHEVQKDRQRPGDHAALDVGQLCQRTRQFRQGRRMAGVSGEGQLADAHDGGQPFRSGDLLDRLVQPLLQTRNDSVEFVWGFRLHRGSFSAFGVCLGRPPCVTSRVWAEQVEQLSDRTVRFQRVT